MLALMYTRFQTEAFVLRIQNRSEADRVYTLFTRESGLVSVRAQSVRKHASKLRFHMQFVSQCQCEYVQGRYLPRLVTALGARHVQITHPLLHQILIKLTRTLTSLCPRDVPERELFDYVVGVRDALEQMNDMFEEGQKDNPEMLSKKVWLVILYRVLFLLGYSDHIAELDITLDQASEIPSERVSYWQEKLAGLVEMSGLV